MTDLEEIVNRPGYARAASGASKTSIFVFAATFSYLVIFSGTSPGFLSGVIFFVAGIFVVSALIAMPLFLLQSKFPKLGSVTMLLSVVATSVLTRSVYLWLFSQPAMAVDFEPRSFKCVEPLPEFTLSRNSNPTDAQIQELCGCISINLSEADRLISKAVVEGRESDISPTELQEFIPRFGDALNHCGGNNL